MVSHSDPSAGSRLLSASSSCAATPFSHRFSMDFPLETQVLLRIQVFLLFIHFSLSKNPRATPSSRITPNTSQPPCLETDPVFLLPSGAKPLELNQSSPSPVILAGYEGTSTAFGSIPGNCCHSGLVGEGENVTHQAMHAG